MDQPVVMVTGASRGLGEAAALWLAKLGATVVLVARGAEVLDAAARACQEAGIGVGTLAAPADVSREEDCARVVQLALERFGRLDGLVNNSGVIEPIGMLRDAPADQWQQNLAVNLLGPVMLTREALPHLRQRRGRVINISSGAAESVIGGWGAYSAAKAALNKITQVLASEEPEIASAALKPGIVDTAMQAAIREKGKDRMAEANYLRLASMYEQGKMNPPEKPALAIACLALAMPHEWSGQVLQWDEERVQDLVRIVTAQD